MGETYRSPYEAYPFLSDKPEDLRCDFEILTDGIVSSVGLLRAHCPEEDLKKALEKVAELVYHSNPTLRTKLTVTQEEVDWLKSSVKRLQEETKGRCKQFVLPQGSQRACIAHGLRVDCKKMVRLLYCHGHSGHTVEPLLIDFASLLSGYFFLTALKLNQMDGIEEIPYISRNY